MCYLQKKKKKNFCVDYSFSLMKKRIHLLHVVLNIKHITDIAYQSLYISRLATWLELQWL